MRKCEVQCPVCRNVTGMSRGAHASVGRDGCVYITCWCDHCGEKLTVMTMNKDGFTIPNTVKFPRRKT